MVLIGTKLDRVREDPSRRQVTEEMALELAATYSAPYFETSAKDGLNVTSVFDTIGYHCLATKLSAQAEVRRASTSPHVSTPSFSAPTSNAGAEVRPTGNSAENRVCCTIQ